MSTREGFSLAEFLIVVGIFAIMGTVGVPQVINAIRRSNFTVAITQLVGDARMTRSLAVSKGGNYRLHAGRDPAIGLPSLYNSYRVERRNPASGWPAASSTTSTSSDVIINWQDVSILYGGITISSVVDGGATAVDGAIFGSSGASVDSSSPPGLRSVNISVRNQDGTTKVLQIDPAGNVKIP